MFLSRHAVTAPDTPSEMSCVAQSTFIPCIIQGMCINFHFTHPMAAITVKKKKRKKKKIILEENLAMAHRHFSVATGWPRFYGYGVLSVFLPGQRRPKRDTCMWAPLSLQQVVHLITTNKGGKWYDWRTRFVNAHTYSAISDILS